MNIPYGTEDAIKGSLKFNKGSYRQFQNFDSDGFVTQNDISHSYIPGACQNIHPTPSSLVGPKPDGMTKINPFVIHDQHVTSNKVFHGPKFYNESRDEQPQYPKAPGIDNVYLIKGDVHRYMQQGWRNGKGYPRGLVKNYAMYPEAVSETKDKFPAKWPDSSYLYGSPMVFTEKRDVFTRPVTLFHPGYDEEDHLHPMHRANPYLSTYKLVHRNFEKDLYKWQHLNAVVNAGNKSNDVAIKYRVRPMQDPFENSLYLKSKLASQDKNKEANGTMDKFAGFKMLFNTPVYSGCAPRSFQPPNFLCNQSTYQGSYSKPFNNKSVLNHHKFFQTDYIPTKMVMSDVFKTPGMYISENKTYGSGNHVPKIQTNTVLNAFDGRL